LYELIDTNIQNYEYRLTNTTQYTTPAGEITWSLTRKYFRLHLH